MEGPLGELAVRLRCLLANASVPSICQIPEPVTVTGTPYRRPFACLAASSLFTREHRKMVVVRYCSASLSKLVGTSQMNYRPYQ